MTHEIGEQLVLQVTQLDGAAASLDFTGVLVEREICEVQGSHAALRGIDLASA
ncbi:hypothetical protein D3C83_239790 [compost metagenome]